MMKCELKRSEKWGKIDLVPHYHYHYWGSSKQFHLPPFLLRRLSFMVTVYFDK